MIKDLITFALGVAMLGKMYAIMIMGYAATWTDSIIEEKLVASLKRELSTVPFFIELTKH